MKLFPETIALLGFFGVEPETAEPKDTPLAYSRLIFSVEVKGEMITCLIDNPALEVRRFRDGVEKGLFSFPRIDELRILEDPGGSVLEAIHDFSDCQLTFRMQLRPMVHTMVGVEL